MTPRKKRPGRPPRATKTATERIEIRVTKLERAAWQHAAIAQDMTLSNWLRTLANEVARWMWDA